MTSTFPRRSLAACWGPTHRRAACTKWRRRTTVSPAGKSRCCATSTTRTTGSRSRSLGAEAPVARRGRRRALRGAVLHGPRDVRYEERGAPRIIEPTDAVIRISAACICGSDLWPYRGVTPTYEPSPMGHEYVGIVEKV